MNQYLYFLLLAFCIFLTIRNFQMIRRNKIDKGYVECYKKVIAKDEDALDYVNNYVESETNPALKNKAFVMKLISELDKGLPYEETLNAISMEEVFYYNNKYANAAYVSNADVFLWIMVALAKAYATSEKEVVEGLFKKISVIEEIKTKVEYKLVESLYGLITKTGNSEFVSGFLIGEYEGYSAEKRFLSLDKRFAEAIKAFANEELDEISKDDIPHFAKTALGEFFMKDLGIFEKYKEEEPKEESYLDGVDKE